LNDSEVLQDSVIVRRWSRRTFHFGQLEGWLREHASPLR
jgi:hypothetical protein